MADRHKSNPQAVRMPDGLRAWYRQHAAETGQHLNTVIVAALEDYRQRHEPATVSIGGMEIPLVADPRQPPGIVSVVVPGKEVTQVRSLTLTPEPAPKRGNCKHPVNRRIGDYCAACEQPVRKGKP